MTSIFNLVRGDIPSSDFFCKSFLAFDAVAGWSVERLNLIQQLCRSIFGAYASTHLATIGAAYKNNAYRFSEADLDLISAKPPLLQLYWASLYSIDVKEACANRNLHERRLKALADVSFDYAHNKVSPYLELPPPLGMQAQFSISEKERARYRLSPRVNQLAARICSAVARLYEERYYWNSAAAYAERAAILSGATRLYYR